MSTLIPRMAPSSTASPVTAALLLLAALMLAVGCSALGQPRLGDNQGAIAEEAASLAPGTVPVKALAPIGDVWSVLENGFVDQDALDADRLSAGAIKGMLDATNDPALRALGAFPRSERSLPGELPEALRPFWDAWSGLFQRFNTAERPLDPVKLSQAAIRGMLVALDDPHTTYISPQRYAMDAPDFGGDYEGIGSEIYSRGGRFVLSPMRGSPAAIAGIRAGDILVAVDGELADTWTVFEAVSRIRGTVGTLVSLEVLHLGEDASVVLEIRRGVIQLDSVSGNMTNDGIAYVRLSAFYGNSTPALVAHIQEALDQGAKGIVLDLRGNPGGLLSTSIEVASQFLGDGLVVYQEDGGGARTDFPVESGGVATDIPLTLLVNRFSASASEVVAGALQDRGRAKLVGVRTFGKGSVNRLRGLSDGGGLYYSFARWYTPDGRLIEGEGLEPDIVVVGTATGNGDPQLEAALRELRRSIGDSQG